MLFDGVLKWGIRAQVPMACVALALGLGSVGAFKERMLPFPPADAVVRTPNQLGADMVKAQPGLGNPLERIMREIRRRTRVVGAFPDGQSCLNLAAARLRYIAGTAWSTKRYMNMRPLYQPQIMQTGAVA